MLDSGFILTVSLFYCGRQFIIRKPKQQTSANKQNKVSFKDQVFSHCALDSKQGARVAQRCEHSPATSLAPILASTLYVVELVSFLLCSGRFLSGYSGFSLFSKPNSYKFQFDYWIYYIKSLLLILLFARTDWLTWGLLAERLDIRLRAAEEKKIKTLNRTLFSLVITFSDTSDPKALHFHKGRLANV